MKYLCVVAPIKSSDIQAYAVYGMKACFKALFLDFI